MVYIIVPAYNEEGGIEAVINGINTSLTNKGYRFEIFVINDGSRDKTSEIVNRINRENITIINHKKNLGISEVLKSGFERVNKISSNDDIVVLIEADNTNDLANLTKMIEKIKEGNDIVIASRLISKGKYVGFPILRKIISIMGNKVLRFSFRLDGITDYTIFYRAYSSKIIKEVFNKYNDNFLKLKGFVSNCEFLFKLSKFTSRICEVPTIYRYNLKKSKSNMELTRTIFQYLKLLWRARNL